MFWQSLSAHDEMRCFWFIQAVSVVLQVVLSGPVDVFFQGTSTKRAGWLEGDKDAAVSVSVWQSAKGSCGSAMNDVLVQSQAVVVYGGEITARSKIEVCFDRCQLLYLHST